MTHVHGLWWGAAAGIQVEELLGFICIQNAVQVPEEQTIQLMYQSIPTVGRSTQLIISGCVHSEAHCWSNAYACRCENNRFATVTASLQWHCRAWSVVHLTVTSTRTAGHLTKIFQTVKCPGGCVQLELADPYVQLWLIYFHIIVWGWCKGFEWCPAWWIDEIDNQYQLIDWYWKPMTNFDDRFSCDIWSIGYQFSPLIINFIDNRYWWQSIYDYKLKNVFVRLSIGWCQSISID